MLNERELVKVKDRPDLVRDSYSKAILSTDSIALQEHRQKKKLFKDMQQTVNEVAQLKHDMGEIKNLLQQLLQKHKRI